MRRDLSWLLTACCFLCFAPTCGAQMDTPEALERRALQAYRSKDYATFVLLEKQVLMLHPADPRAIYSVASGEALLGHSAEAVHLLDQIVSLHLDFGADEDPDFTNIRKTLEWAQFQDRLRGLRQPVVHSAVAFTLPEKGLLAGSVVVDGTSGDSYVGSVRARKVIKRSKDGGISDFATEKDGLLAVSSLLLDSARNELFVSSAALPAMRGFRKEDEGKAALCVFDLTTGKLIRTATLSVPGVHHVLAQMAEDKSGNVFVVDTGTSEIRRLRRASTELELFISSVVFPAPRGLALSADERTLYVVDAATGIWALEVLSNDRTHIDVPPAIWLGGLSGLARDSDGFIALQSGVKPNRIVRIVLDTKAQKVVSAETLESNHPFYETPTPGTITGANLYYVADSQFDLIDPKSGAFAENRARETVILRLPLAK